MYCSHSDTLKQATKFTYFGLLITDYGKFEVEINREIENVQCTLGRMKKNSYIETRTTDTEAENHQYMFIVHTALCCKT